MRAYSPDLPVLLQYSYVQLGCSKRAEQLMLAYARTLVGKPFSNLGMARSLLFPRTTTGDSFFCAELVASVLQKGGLMSSSSNPGAATPESLHRLYKNQAAVTGNPYVLRQFNMNQGAASYASLARAVVPERRVAGFVQMPSRPVSAPAQRAPSSDFLLVPRRRGDSPPRASFTCVSARGEGAAPSGHLHRKQR